MTGNVHVPAEPIGGEVQFCARCGLVLMDVSDGWASSDGQPPAFRGIGIPLLVQGGFKISLDVADPNRDTSDEIECAA